MNESSNEKFAPKFCKEGLETRIEGDAVGLTVDDAIHIYAILDALDKGDTIDHLSDGFRRIADDIEYQINKKIENEQL